MTSNQSRPVMDPVDDDALDPRESFSYSPLDPNVDCIRLVIIEAAKPHSNMISCRLQHVTFAQKPKYEALSYTWGDQLVEGRILLDGKLFEVGRNLMHALGYLQDPVINRVLWIDAICIDQGNIPERNRQLPIMPHIYQRASRVIISLYYPREGWPDFPSECSWEFMFTLKDPDGSSILVQNYRQSLLRGMCRDQYWKRVWVIQECSLARQLQVQYGEVMLDWKTFIAALKLSEEFDTSVPLRLQKQMDRRYTDGHKLCNLLKSHQDALCKEPHDKVYGFIGLATDTIEGFPMDYQKTLFDVWVDTILFQNAKQESPQHDIIHFSRLVKKLLGAPVVQGTSIQPLLSNDGLYLDHKDGKKHKSYIPDQITVCIDINQFNNDFPGFFDKNDARCRSTRDRNQRKLLIPARVVGRIIHFGPTYNEIISDLKKTDSWRCSINTNLPENLRASAREESDLFLRSLEGLEDEDLGIITSYNRNMSWEIGPGDPAFKSIIYLKRSGRDTGPIEPIFSANFDWEGDDTDSQGEPRLFLLGEANDYKTSPADMGLASPEAQVGDCVCQVLGFKQAFVVRHLTRVDGKYLIHGLRIVGTAGLAENRFKAQIRREANLEGSSKFDNAHFDFISDTETVDLVIDVSMVYQLLN